MKPLPTHRADYPQFTEVPTRWGDNDSYGHVNNVVYYEYFDTAVNRHLIEAGVLDIASSPVIALVVETQCRYHSSVGFPARLSIGMKVVHLGSSSVRYELGVFKGDDDTASAVGSFVHVYVDRATTRPVGIPAEVRAVLQSFVHPPA
jgi:acyl-CoA thioester hydrolase